jgi:GAF domain-containing protein
MAHSPDRDSVVSGPSRTRAATPDRLEAARRSPSRLQAVSETALVGTLGTEALDRLTRLACRLLGAPVSLVTLLDDETSSFISAAGMPEQLAHVRRVPLSHSLCLHAVALGEPVALEDALEDDVFRHHPVVTEMGARAYLGAPLFNEHGEALGTLCTIDLAPRPWPEADVQILRDLSALTMAEIRRHIAERGFAQVTQEKAELLEQATRTRAEFLRVIGREVRSPIAAIMGQAELLRDDVPAGAVRETLDSIRAAAQSVNGMISEMLRVSELDSEALDVGDTAQVRFTADIRRLLDQDVPRR